MVRNGKGEKDRITVLPDRCREAFRDQILRVSRLHEEDLRNGQGRVYLPRALDGQFQNAEFQRLEYCELKKWESEDCGSAFSELA